MKKYVSYKQAKKLLNLGFVEPCYAQWVDKNTLVEGKCTPNDVLLTSVLAPTLFDAIMWMLQRRPLGMYGFKIHADYTGAIITDMLDEEFNDWIEIDFFSLKEALKILLKEHKRLTSF